MALTRKKPGDGAQSHPCGRATSQCRGMNRCHAKPASEDQAQYARLRALLDIRIAELIRALDRHESDRRNWKHYDVLAAVEGRVHEALFSLRRLSDVTHSP